MNLNHWIGKVLLALALAACGMVHAQAPLKSSAWRGYALACTGNDTLMPLDGGPNYNWHTQSAPSGAGPYPAGYNITVRKVCVTHFTSDPNAYAVVGHSGPNGDHVSPVVIGNGTQCMSYEKDAPVVVIGGEYFDVHAACNSGSHSAILQLWYTQP